MVANESVEAVALEHMRRAEYGAAAAVLRAAIDRDPKRTDLMRILNLITPCGMVAEALDALRRKVMLQC